MDMDMDDASEEDLRRMDLALSSVFTEKYKMKDEQKRELTFTLRVLNLMEMLVKRSKIPEASIPLMLLIPSISFLIKAVKIKNIEMQSRSFRLMRRLNTLKKVKAGEGVEPSLVKQVCADILETLNKKLPKNVRVLIRDSLVMVNKCYGPSKQIKEEDGDAQDEPPPVKQNRKRKHLAVDANLP